MTDKKQQKLKQHKEHLNKVGNLLILNGYTDDYTLGITENERAKIEFIHNDNEIRFVYLDNKKLDTYLNNNSLGQFANYEKAMNYIDIKYKKLECSKETDKISNYIDRITEVTNKCLNLGLKNKLYFYTVLIMRNYQLTFNPTADNRKLPWKVFLNELNQCSEISSELEEHLDMYIREATQCYYDNKDKVKKEEAILYHGSPNKRLTKLEIGKEKTTGDEFGAGIYLTKSYDEAEGYAGPNGRVYKVELDETNLFNLNEKLPSSIADIVKQELLDNKDVYNQIISHNRKQFNVVDMKEGQTFYNNKKKEWQDKDNIYMSNMPTVTKTNGKLIVNYSDFDSIDEAINNLTGDELQKILSHNMDPNIFVEIVIEAGYDGIITHNNNWYIIYRKEDKVKILEHKIEEATRNELLAKTKKQTITRYNKASGYKGFSIVDIDTNSVFTTNSLRVTCRIGDYWDTVEMQNILYWIQLEAEKNKTFQVNTKGVTSAIMNSIDGMDIKVDCECGDWQYRMAYQATKFGYKYGKPENRPAKITNPNDYGALCKHLTAMLSNKKWLQQVSGTLMDFIEKRIDDVNRFLRPKKGEELTLPNQLARQNAKAGFYSKLFKDKDETEEVEDVKSNNNNTNNDTDDNDNVQSSKNNNKSDNVDNSNITNNVDNNIDEKEGEN